MLLIIELGVVCLAVGWCFGMASGVIVSYCVALGNWDLKER